MYGIPGYNENKVAHARARISLSDWLKIVVVSAITLLITWTVCFGVWVLVVETGRAILHP